MDTATEKEVKRAAIESEHNGARDAIEKQFVVDRNDREAQFHADLDANREAKETAMLAAGLNRDGSDPQDRPVSP